MNLLGKIEIVFLSFSGRKIHGPFIQKFTSDSIGFTATQPRGKVPPMKNFLLVPFVTAVLVASSGCSNRPTPSNVLDPTGSEPWLCQGLDGEWQCQRGGISPAAQSKAAGISEVEDTQLSVTDVRPIMQMYTETQTVTPKIKTATAHAGSKQSAPPRRSTPDNESLWTIQWVALSTETATEAFTERYFAGANLAFEVEHIQVGERRYYILFSGRYTSKALAAEAAAQTPHTGGDAPYLRTLASIAAVKVD